MSDLLNSASLVVIPSGYKEDTVYSVVPSDGSGDLSFTRASNGTRINSAGLVEVCPWNLLQQSEAFDSTGWTKNAVSVTPNTTISPDGNTTADTLSVGVDAVSVRHRLSSNSVSSQVIGTTYTSTFYLKANQQRWIQILGNIGYSTGVWANFDLVNGTIGNTGGTDTIASIDNVGNGWYRCRVSGVATGTTTTGFEIIVINDTNGGRYPSYQSLTAEDVCYIWGAQLNEGSTAKPYFPTTDRLNVPRLTYQNGGGGCPSLLLEPQRTNLALRSEEIGISPWTSSGGTTIANATTSPSGDDNADKFEEDSSTGQHYPQQSITVSSLTTYTMSIFAKKAERDIVYIRCFDSTFGTIYANVNFNLTTGVASGSLAKIESFGNGWYRCSVTFTTIVDTTVRLRLNINSDSNYTGVSGYGLYLYGAQLEVGAYPTSYIPTTAASATRVADACFKTGISSLIGQTEGVMFVDVDFTHNTSGSNAYLMQIRQDSNNRILIYRDSGNNGIGVVALKAGGAILANASSVSSNTRHKIAVAYKSGDLAFYIDGVQIATSSNTFSAYSSHDALDLGCNNTSGTPVELGDYEYNEALLFKTRLTNAELASLTTI
jgi:hypothetical protein